MRSDSNPAPVSVNDLAEILLSFFDELAWAKTLDQANVTACTAYVALEGLVGPKPKG